MITKLTPNFLGTTRQSLEKKKPSIPESLNSNNQLDDMFKKKSTASDVNFSGKLEKKK